MLETGLIDPYPVVTEFPDDWSFECADVFDEGEREYGCCEGGWKPLPDGSFTACWECLRNDI